MSGSSSIGVRKDEKERNLEVASGEVILMSKEDTDAIVLDGYSSFQRCTSVGRYGSITASSTSVLSTDTAKPSALFQMCVNDLFVWRRLDKSLCWTAISLVAILPEREVHDAQNGSTLVPCQAYASPYAAVTSLGPARSQGKECRRALQRSSNLRCI